MSIPGRAELLELYNDLRLTDVRDGMDTVLLHHIGSMQPHIRPLERKRAVGIARTARYLPFVGRVPEKDAAGYWEWSGMYYNEICPYPWVDQIEDGDFVVIDQSGVDAGLMGSENTLNCLRRGVRGFVTNGGVRDTDEIILQGIPFWSAMISKSMVQSRLQFDAMDVPVAVGGVTVRPGDVVVADGDGVVVVPQEYALAVAKAARDEHERDKVSRRKHYEALGWKPDETM
ncbi:MAG: RraA family protein [Spirochaetota bacterium]